MRAITYWCGFVAGVALALLTIDWRWDCGSIVSVTPAIPAPRDDDYERWFRSQGLHRRPMSADERRYGAGDGARRTEAAELRRRVTLACVVSATSEAKSRALADTWALSCDRLLTYDGRRPQMGSNVNKSLSSFSALCSAARRAYAASPPSAWVLFVRDDTFCVPENLRRLVASLDATLPWYLGHAVELWGVDYNAAGAGFVLSRGALNLLMKAFPDDSACQKGGKYFKQEDYYLGKHLQKLGIRPIDTRDEYGDSVFLGFDLDKMMFPDAVRRFSNYYTRAVYPVKCCSYRTVAFPVSSHTEMYKYYYMIYTVQIFLRGSLGNGPAPTLEPEEFVWKNFLREAGAPLNLTSKEYEKTWYVRFENATAFPGFERRNYKESDEFADIPLRDFNLTDIPNLLADMLFNYSSYKL